jgi:hypothetical protein
MENGRGTVAKYDDMDGAWKCSICQINIPIMKVAIIVLTVCCVVVFVICDSEEVRCIEPRSKREG